LAARIRTPATGSAARGRRRSPTGGEGRGHVGEGEKGRAAAGGRRGDLGNGAVARGSSDLRKQGESELREGASMVVGDHASR
jgi:hypothetical protein